jgi:hypothetical protein
LIEKITMNMFRIEIPIAEDGLMRLLVEGDYGNGGD